MNESDAETPVSRLSDPDMRGVPAALMRAARRARETAVRTGTPLVIRENGRLIERMVDAEEIGEPKN